MGCCTSRVDAIVLLVIHMAEVERKVDVKSTQDMKMSFVCSLWCLKPLAVGRRPSGKSFAVWTLYVARPNIKQS